MKRPFKSFLCAVLAASILATSAVPTASAQDRLIEQQISSEETTANIINQDRGFYSTLPVYNTGQATEYDESCAYTSYIESIKNKNAVSLVYLCIDLDAEGVITAQDIFNIEYILQIIRKNELKAIVRALYDNGNSDDKQNLEPESVDVIYGHIRKLCEAFNKEKTAIAVVQFGLFGPWGEMHTSKFLPYDQNYVLDTSYLKLVAAEYLKNLDKDLQLSVRRPSYYRAIFNTKLPITADSILSGEDYSRVGMHNDGYLGTKTDYGTYEENEIDFELAFQNEHNRYTIFGGEAVCSDTFRENADGDYAIDYMQLTHASYLNNEWNTALHDKWKNDDCKGNTDADYANAYDYIAAHLGYRYVLKKSYLSENAVNGGDIEINLEIENTGFSNIVKNHDVEIVFSNGSESHISDTELDPRFWNSGEKTELDFKVNVPEKCTEGEWQLYLKIPDRSGIDECAVEFANKDGYSTELCANYIGKINVSKALEVIGDIDGDGSCGISDLAMLKRFLLGIAELNERQSATADINNDGAVNVIDYITILQNILKV